MKLIIQHPPKSATHKELLLCLLQVLSDTLKGADLNNDDVLFNVTTTILTAATVSEHASQRLSERKEFEPPAPEMLEWFRSQMVRIYDHSETQSSL